MQRTPVKKLSQPKGDLPTQQPNSVNSTTLPKSIGSPLSTLSLSSEDMDFQTVSSKNSKRPHSSLDENPTKKPNIQAPSDVNGYSQKKRMEMTVYLKGDSYNLAAEVR